MDIRVLFWGLLHLLLLNTSAYGQEWMSLKQAPISLQYEIPKNWFVGGYMDTKTCTCPGGTLNTSATGNINMLVYTSSSQELEALKAAEIWGYTFAEAENTQEFKTDHLTFEQTYSTWQQDKDLTVIRLITTIADQPYVFYFWATPKDFEKKGALIERIVKSIKPL